MFFQDRAQAAKLLTEKLGAYRGKNPLVLAIPRGAVPMAKAIAEQLGGLLDVVLVHKLGAPGQPEFAVGAVDEVGHLTLNPYARQMGIPEAYLAQEKEEQLETLRRRRKLYTPGRGPKEPSGRIVIVVDDGIATGATMIAALQNLRAQNPAKLVVATPVAPPDTVRRLGDYADEVIVLDTPQNFYAVGQFYEDFSQVADEEVIEALKGG